MPRTQITETTLYQYDELSDGAKDTARDWFREHIGQDFSDFSAEHVLSDANDVAALLGIRINTRTAQLMGGGSKQEPVFYWEVGSCRGTDGASFTGYYNYRPGSVQAVAKEWPQDSELKRIAMALQAAQKRYFYRLAVAITRNSYSRGADSSTMSVDVEYDGPDYREIDTRTYEDIAQAITDFADWIGDRLTAEWEYQHSDEVVAENIRVNEYEFDEGGNRA